MTFYFYDLETTGFNPREARIMQFAGQRTDMDLNPIGEPHNILIKLTDDVLPEPDAIMITGITPQSTIADGITEAEFLKIFQEEVATPGTIFVGFNTVRFDDEFMRYLQYRNFYDPYEWQYKDDKSRWDLLDVVRMTRALRPDGIEWPVDDTGKAVNKLELLTKANGLEHEAAHDALSDVRASIALAKLIQTKQPKLFDYLLSIRDKKRAAALINSGQPFVYTSGKYAAEFDKTTVAGMLTEVPNQFGSALVFDLRYDPTPFLELDPSALAEAMRRLKDDPGPRLPVKTIKYNKCPAVAPLSVLDEASQERLKLTPETYLANYEKLKMVGPQLAQQVIKAFAILDQKQKSRLLEVETDVDAQLYDGFFDNVDRTKMSVVRAAGPDELRDLQVSFKDERLEALLPLYKARNFPKSLSDEDREAWERFRERKLLGGGTKSRMARFFGRLAELGKQDDLSENQRYLLEELQLYGQSIVPSDISE
ncbi:MAG: Exodeoxyribonuclease [Candidatus Saccharibacteria bacterium]|nr:Exodeoxyribonuclease [Candidatus Saccharibacteria bacterium]